MSFRFSRLAGLAAFAVLAGTTGACSFWGTVAGGAAVGATAAQTEKGFRRSVSDTEIRIAINDLWFKADEEMFRKLNLQVQEGRVLLSGNVSKAEQRVEAVRLAWQAPGVSEVINEIDIDESSGLDAQARDAWITKELEATLLLDNAVSSINYSVVTVDKVIYLMGVAQSQAELDRVVGHAKDISYVRRVVNYVLLKDDPARSSGTSRQGQG